MNKPHLAHCANIAELSLSFIYSKKLWKKGSRKGLLSFKGWFNVEGFKTNMVFCSLFTCDTRTRSKRVVRVYEMSECFKMQLFVFANFNDISFREKILSNYLWRAKIFFPTNVWLVSPPLHCQFFGVWRLLVYLPLLSVLWQAILSQKCENVLFSNRAFSLKTSFKFYLMSYIHFAKSLNIGFIQAWWREVWPQQPQSTNMLKSIGTGKFITKKCLQGKQRMTYSINYSITKVSK